MQKSNKTLHAYNYLKSHTIRFINFFNDNFVILQLSRLNRIPDGLLLVNYPYIQEISKKLTSDFIDLIKNQHRLSNKQYKYNLFILTTRFHAHFAAEDLGNSTCLQLFKTRPTSNV